MREYNSCWNTRIKVLEAFAYKKPVVSTSMGIEGIEAVPDTLFLLGDNLEDFADQCLKVLGDEDLRFKFYSFQQINSYNISPLSCQPVTCIPFRL